MIAATPVAPWRGDAAAVRAHGDAVLRGLGVPPSPIPGMLAEAISPADDDPFLASLNAGLRTLLGAVRSREAGDAAAAGARLTGLGGGSTPLGDDYLIGALLGVWALGRAAGFRDPARARWIAAIVPGDVERRTSPVSVALLRFAAEGSAPEPLHPVLDPGRPDLGSALGALTAIGASSGRGCAAAIGATALLISSNSRRTPGRFKPQRRLTPK